MLRIQSLASGSKGNCTYVAGDGVSFLVDIGLNLKQLLGRMADADIDPQSISGVLITHEHSDHISGVYSFVKRFKCKIYIHKKACNCFLDKIKERGGEIDENLVVSFVDKFDVDEVQVDFFELPHDSQFCFGYTFKSGDSKVSLATDLGSCSDAVLQKMAGSQIVLLEANHDPVKLAHNVRYPSWLKRRVAGGHGHLSNGACSRAVYKLATLGVEQVILAHLSAENNSPSLAYRVVKDFLAEKGLIEGQDIFIDVATQDKVGRLFEV